MSKRQRGLVIILAVATALAGGTLAFGRTAFDDVSEYLAQDGSHYEGLRPTSVGLPQIGIGGAAGASELVHHLRRYHDNGRYEKDLRLIAGAAKSYIAKRLADDTAPAKRVRKCNYRYRRVRSGIHKGYFRRTGRCRTRRVAPERIDGKPAIMFDIDETSLSNYSGMAALGFTTAGQALPAALGTGTAIRPTLDLYKWARSRGIATFFVTGRPDLIEGPTVSNLRAAGYSNWDGLQFKPSGLHTEEYKAGARAAIEKKGYDIIANLGDQESDLDGGHADRGFKYPNPFYFISD